MASDTPFTNFNVNMDLDPSLTKFNVKVDINEGMGGAKADTYLAQYRKAIKNLTDNHQALVTDIKKSADSLEQSFFIETNMAHSAEKAFAHVQASQIRLHGGRNVVPSTYKEDPNKVDMAQFTSEIKDKYQEASVASLANRHGGSMKKSETGKGFFDFTAPRIPVDKDPEGNDILLEDAIKNKILSVNDSAREKEEAKLQEAEEKAKAKKSKDSNSDLLSSVNRKASIVLLVKLVSEVVKILGKIFSLVSMSSAQAMQDQIDSAFLGLKDYELRRYRVFENTKNLPERTFSGIMTGLINSLKNPSSLDTKLLEKLAPLIQSDTGKVLKDVMAGGNGAEDSMHLIFKSAIDRILEGKDLLGIPQKDQAGALQSTVSALQNTSISGMAPVIQRFFQEYNEKARSPAEQKEMLEGLDSWMSMVDHIFKASGVSTQDTTNATASAKLLQEISSLLAVFKEGIGIKISGSLFNTLSSIDQFLRKFAPKGVGSDEIDKVREKLEHQEAELSKEKKKLEFMPSIAESKDTLKKSILANAGELKGYYETSTGENTNRLDSMIDKALAFDQVALVKLRGFLGEEDYEQFASIVYQAYLESELDKELKKVQTQLGTDDPKRVDKATPDTAIDNATEYARLFFIQANSSWAKYKDDESIDADFGFTKSRILKRKINGKYVQDMEDEQVEEVRKRVREKIPESELSRRNENRLDSEAKSEAQLERVFIDTWLETEGLTFLANEINEASGKKKEKLENNKLLVDVSLNEGQMTVKIIDTETKDLLASKTSDYTAHADKTQAKQFEILNKVGGN